MVIIRLARLVISPCSHKGEIIDPQRRSDAERRLPCQMCPDFHPNHPLFFLASLLAFVCIGTAN